MSHARDILELETQPRKKKPESHALPVAAQPAPPSTPVQPGPENFKGDSLGDLQAKLENLPLADLVPSEIRFAKPLDSAAFREGWPEDMPPLFAFRGGAELSLQDGHNRWKAATEAGLTHGPVVTIPWEVAERLYEQDFDRLDMRDAAFRALGLQPLTEVEDPKDVFRKVTAGRVPAPEMGGSVSGLALRRLCSRYPVEAVYIRYMKSFPRADGILQINFRNYGLVRQEWASFEVLAGALLRWRNLEGAPLYIDGKAAGTVSRTSKTLLDIDTGRWRQPQQEAEDPKTFFHHQLPIESKTRFVRLAIQAAELVLPIFTEKFPNDDRPAKAIQAAKNWLEHPDQTESTKAAYAASTAARAAAVAAAPSAARAAAHAASNAADAAASAAYAAYAAYAADRGAINAAYAASAASNAADAATYAAARAAASDAPVRLFRPGLKAQIKAIQDQIKRLRGIAETEDPKTFFRHQLPIESKAQFVRLAVQAAELVLPLFTEKFPNDDRPAKAIQAAKSWLEHPGQIKSTYAAAAVAHAAHTAYAAADDAAAAPAAASAAPAAAEAGCAAAHAAHAHYAADAAYAAFKAAAYAAADAPVWLVRPGLEAQIRAIQDQIKKLRRIAEAEDPKTFFRRQLPIESKVQFVRLAVQAAELVLPIFTEKFPNDDRPAKAIQVAKNWLEHPDQTESTDAVVAAIAAYAAAVPATDEAAYAAAHVAHAAAHVASAVIAAIAAARAAAHAADAAVHTAHAAAAVDYDAAHAAHAVEAVDDAYAAAATDAAAPTDAADAHVRLVRPGLEAQIRAIQDQIKKLRGIAEAEDPKTFFRHQLPIQFKTQFVRLAVQAAELVLPIFTEKFPNDDRPAKAIQAAKNLLEHPGQIGSTKAAHAAASAAAFAAADAPGRLVRPGLDAQIKAIRDEIKKLRGIVEAEDPKTFFHHQLPIESKTRFVRLAVQAAELVLPIFT